MSSSADGRSEGPQGAAASLLNGLRVLEAFRVDDPTLGVTDVAQRVGLHKSTVSRILSGLAEAGYVHRDQSTGRYRLGLGVISLAGPLLAELDVRRLAQGELEKLTKVTAETSALSVWNGMEAVVVEQIPSPQFVKHTAYIGTRYDRYESSSVRLFLAHLAAENVKSLLGSKQISRDPAEVLNDDVAAHLAQVRDDGFAINDGYTDAQEFGISAPVYDYAGALVGCVTLSAPRARIGQSDVPRLLTEVQHCVERISDGFGAHARSVDADIRSHAERGR
ncbi:IclR family transcriptional regulator [Arthrobacter echini]|uniref:Glycerol operon regulatory protein n=1 Tax=Arthrobacter echini TaxID=1529066 RepID=A0A4S5E9K7_9MICC|nr:IclR family transcriptional regulator [Arthrobacter echini]THJ68381.1 IclR family transcriptional regulator [Arthrobacter echini]